MSHEGIRIVDEETARRESAAETRLPQDAVAPAKVRVMQSEGTGVSIDWKDGHRSSWTFSWLRHACPGGPLVLYEAPPRPREVTPVGKYAVRFKWNDGHESGIYSWEYLRRVCQCTVCAPAHNS